MSIYEIASQMNGRTFKRFMCYVKLGFKATPRIKKWPLAPDHIPYHPCAQYPVVWIYGVLISPEASEVGHQIVGE